MGRDKGRLDYHGEPQAVHAWRLLQSVCGQAHVSVAPAQAATPPYSSLPLIPDTREGDGPAAGLLSAWARRPDAAWLVLAVDMPLADRPLLTALIAARDPSACATAYRSDDGTIEPLCAIWEPAARPGLEQAVAEGRKSPRRFLETCGAALLPPPDPDKLTSVNDAAAHDALRRRLGRT